GRARERDRGVDNVPGRDARAAAGARADFQDAPVAGGRGEVFARAAARLIALEPGDVPRGRHVPGRVHERLRHDRAGAEVPGDLVEPSVSLRLGLTDADESAIAEVARARLGLSDLRRALAVRVEHLALVPAAEDRDQGGA